MGWFDHAAFRVRVKSSDVVSRGWTTIERTPAEGGGLEGEAADVAGTPSSHIGRRMSWSRRAGRPAYSAGTVDRRALLEGHPGAEEQGGEEGQHNRQTPSPFSTVHATRYVAAAITRNLSSTDGGCVGPARQLGRAWR